ncbi:MAG: helix-turn-helix domain-containing protein [Lachnospiraceae bacterium]|nr:helix-turn-helix domain-containing protein [Lachnospiraceae bacterium]
MEELFTNNESTIVSSDRVLYTAGSFARCSLLHLQEIGTLKALRPHTSSRSDLQSYLFFIVTKGSGSLIYDDSVYSLSAGSCAFIDCKYPYSHTTAPDNLWELRWCHFYGPTMTTIYNKYCERGGRPVFTPTDPGQFYMVLSDLYNIAGSEDYIRDMLINEHLGSLIRLIMSESWHPENQALPSKKAGVLEVKRYLDENYSERINLDDLCNRFFISKYYLTHSFKEQFGLSITNYLLSVRITHAKQLLRFSGKTVEEIGYEVGIGAPAYFSRVFKNVEGVSPSVYREQW